MSAYPAWTPAPRPGIVPLEPLTFGVLLGRSLTALRHNPRVLLGFALTVQIIATLVVTAVTAVTAGLAFSRVATLRPGDPDYATVFAGSILVTVLVGVVLSALANVLVVIVQGVVVVEVTHAVVAERPTLGQIWRRVRPAAWRLVGYSFLMILVGGAGVASLAVVIIALAGVQAVPVSVLLTVLALLAALPLSLWLSTKLLLVPAVLIVEGAPIGVAIARSWRLTRGRFWAALGVIFIIAAAFGIVAQTIGSAVTFVGSGVAAILAPTDDPASASIMLIVVTAASSVLTLLVQSVQLIVQASAATLVYVDCRMRHEGLDIDLLRYVERRDSGMPTIDPWTAHIGTRAVSTVPGMP